MGYSTQFEGVLKFKSPPSVAELAALGNILGEDARDHPEWKAHRDVCYIDLEVTADGSGLKWTHAEKTYGLVEAVNLITRLMREQFPDFQLSGALLAQGESFGDVWQLNLDESGHATRTVMKLVGHVKCPECGHKFPAAGNEA